MYLCHLFLNLSVQEFIEEILSSPFGGMIAFVKEAEALMEKGQLDRLKSDEGEKSLVVCRWKLNQWFLSG